MKKALSAHSSLNGMNGILIHNKPSCPARFREVESSDTSASKYDPMHLEHTGQQADETFVREISRSSFPFMSNSPRGAWGRRRGRRQGNRQGIESHSLVLPVGIERVFVSIFVRWEFCNGDRNQPCVFVGGSKI
jgi:hypothetical protein